jgi:riboflavin kinase/FMN adenylyltransferase
MQVQFGLDKLEPDWSSSIVTIGTFDGIHLGHQALIQAAVNKGIKEECPSIVVTFDRHPLETLRPEAAPTPLNSLSQNLDQISRTGVSGVLVLPFDQSMAEMTAGEFYESILVERLRAAAVVVGYDFAFGKGREGTAAWLSRRCSCDSIQPVFAGDQKVSSTSIRRAVSDGDMSAVTTMLGRPFAIRGAVAAGKKLGRTIGYPTLNLQRMSQTILPRFGVYAGFAETSLGRFSAAVSIGTNPAVGGTRTSIEAYLLDFPAENLYGTSVDLELVKFVREEQIFPSVDDLKAQIAIDVEQIRSLTGP